MQDYKENRKQEIIAARAFDQEFANCNRGNLPHNIRASLPMKLEEDNYMITFSIDFYNSADDFMQIQRAVFEFNTSTNELFEKD